MFAKMIRLTAMATLVLASASVVANAQDFQKSYSLAKGGQVRIGNVSGDVKVTGYEGDAVLVKAYKKGADRDVIEVEDRSTAGRVDIRAKYPENRRNTDASIDFEVQVPRSIPLDYQQISSVSGDVSVEGVSGRVQASSVSGTVRVRAVSGSVTANAVSGDVDVEINELDGSEDMKFAAVSGDVNVTMPANLDADVEISTLSGDIDTNFPIEVKKEKYAPGRRASAKLGEGTRRLKMNTVSGSISLKH
jgi:DUF4097 and DUF4098 domain-containing protein YvlB